ncbi:MAG: hypothetical protein V3T88_01695 [Nitrosomonadaceae bacterium]
MANDIIMTVMKDGNDCQFYADIFPVKDSKFCQTANPVTFTRRALFTKDPGKPMLVLPLDVAKKMAEGILKL